jgi:5,5'-dehydrodivanillate O-demethylase
VREYLGLIFAFLGEGEPSEFPRYEEFEHFEGLLQTDSYVRHCNFYQNLENSLDQSHIGYVHGASAAAFGRVLGHALRAQESDWGLTYTYTRQDGGAFVLQFGMPNIACLATLPRDSETGFQQALHWYVPIDELSHIQFTVKRVPVKGEAAQRTYERGEARRREIDLPHQRLAEEILAGRLRMAAVDPKRCDMVRLQDDVSQIGQRRIADRSLEHPGSGDVGVAMVRRLWLRELQAIAEGRPRKAWKRPGGLRASIWGMNAATSEETVAANPRIVDIRPFVEVDVQMQVLGSQMP